MASWLSATLIERRDWNPHLFSLTFQCSGFPSFVAGQFTKIGLEQDGKLISRAYSIVNSPNQPELIEVLLVPVENGLLSPRLQDLKLGDSAQIMQPATGYLTLDEVPESQNLWLMATGTGVGPFISILSGSEVWQRFDMVTLVYGVRQGADLAYLDDITLWQQDYADQFCFIPVVSREKVTGALHGRIPALLEQQVIQSQSHQLLDATSSQVMLCGNPAMIEDCFKVLEKLGLRKHLRRSPGQITQERYW